MFRERISSQLSEATSRVTFIRNTYLWLVGGFCVAATGALSAQCIGDIMWQVFGRTYTLILFAAQIGSLIWAGAVIKRKPLNRYVYAIFTFICGVFAGIIIDSIQRPGSNIALVAFCTTATIFLLLSGIAFFSGRDFSFLRNFVIIGVGAMFFGSLLAIIFNVEIFDLLVSSIAVVTCSAKILWDTSVMLRTEDYSDSAGFALSLFVGLYNIFLSLMRILSGHRD
jgi:modulator of FtsH protease